MNFCGYVVKTPCPIFLLEKNSRTLISKLVSHSFDDFLMFPMQIFDSMGSVNPKSLPGISGLPNKYLTRHIE